MSEKPKRNRYCLDCAQRKCQCSRYAKVVSGKWYMGETKYVFGTLEITNIPTTFVYNGHYPEQEFL